MAVAISAASVHCARSSRCVRAMPAGDTFARTPSNVPRLTFTNACVAWAMGHTAACQR